MGRFQDCGYQTSSTIQDPPHLLTSSTFSPETFNLAAPQFSPAGFDSFGDASTALSFDALQFNTSRRSQIPQSKHVRRFLGW